MDVQHIVMFFGSVSVVVWVLYDMLDSQGVDFSNAQFSIQMTNELDDQNPISAYLFIKSKVVVAWADSGVEVIN